jgi:hypothetical protein
VNHKSCEAEGRPLLCCHNILIVCDLVVRDSWSVEKRGSALCLVVESMRGNSVLML